MASNKKEQTHKEHMTQREEHSSTDNASVLLRNALRKIESGDQQSALRDVQLAEKYLKLGERESADDGLTAEGRSFGSIYEIFEDNLEHLYKTEGGKAAIARFIAEVKRNEILRDQFDMMEAIQSIPEDANAEECVREICEKTRKHPRKDTKKANRKLCKILSGHCEWEDDEAPDMFYEALETIATEGDDIRKVAECIAAKKTIVELLPEYQRVAKKPIQENRPIDKAAIIKEWANKLTADEVDLVQSMRQNPKGVFDEYKNKALDAIMECKSNADVAQRAALDIIYEQIEGLNFSQKEYDNVENIVKFMGVIEETAI